MYGVRVQKIVGKSTQQNSYSISHLIGTVATHYYTTKTIFGKDQRMPATGYISYPPLSAPRRIIFGSKCLYNVDSRVSVLPLTRSHARGFSAQQRRVWTCCFCLFLCLLLSSYFVGSNHVILQFKSS